MLEKLKEKLKKKPKTAEELLEDEKGKTVPLPISIIPLGMILFGILFTISPRTFTQNPEILVSLPSYSLWGAAFEPNRFILIMLFMWLLLVVAEGFLIFFNVIEFANKKLVLALEVLSIILSLFVGPASLMLSGDGASNLFKEGYVGGYPLVILGVMVLASLVFLVWSFIRTSLSDKDPE